MNIRVKNKLIEFVSRIERRNGFCNDIELFQIVDLWLLVFNDMEKYDNLTVTKQLEKMWRDLKMMYINIGYLNNPDNVSELKKTISNLRDRELVDICYNICKLISTGEYTLHDACIKSGASEKTFQNMRTRYKFLNEEYKKSKKLKSQALKKMKKMGIRRKYNFIK